MRKLLIFALIAPLLLGFVVAQAQTWDVYGQVRIYNGSCDTGIGMNGVTVLLYDNVLGVSYSTVTDTDSAFMAAHNLTSPLGIYYFDNVPYGSDYYVEVVPPLGVELATNAEYGSWWNANPRAVAGNPYRCFLLVLEGANFSPRTMGYWKHQATVAVTGQGNAQVPAAQLQVYLNMVFDLFNDAPYFPIAGVSSVSGAPLTPQNMLTTFNAPNGGSAGMVNKAKKQLLAMLLNVAAEYVYVWQDISADDRSISQAISFAAHMIGPPSGSNVGTAHNALDLINNGTEVPAGWIPGSYGLIYYGDPQVEIALSTGLPETPLLLRNYPNPFNPQTKISYVLPAAGFVKLEVFDPQGRLVQTLVNGWRELGLQEAIFNGFGLSSGMYLYRLRAGYFSAVGKMILAK